MEMKLPILLILPPDPQQIQSDTKNLFILGAIKKEFSLYHDLIPSFSFTFNPHYLMGMCQKEQQEWNVQQFDGSQRKLEMTMTITDLQFW